MPPLLSEGCPQTTCTQLASRALASRRAQVCAHMDDGGVAVLDTTSVYVLGGPVSNGVG